MSHINIIKVMKKILFVLIIVFFPLVGYAQVVPPPVPPPPPPGLPIDGLSSILVLIGMIIGIHKINNSSS